MSRNNGRGGGNAGERQQFGRHNTKGRGRGRGRGSGRGSGRGRGRGRGGNGGRYTGRNNHRNAATRYEVTPSTPIGAYQFCSQEECEERQSLSQVHPLEATKETCLSPQAQRVLHPALAVSKYKRSAAGTTNYQTTSVSALQHKLQHLQHTCATRQATPNHPPVDDIESVLEFMVDRLRACQADATRLSISVPVEFHIQLIRLLLWIRYWTYSSKESSSSSSWMQRTIQLMLSTAFDSYWSVRQVIDDDFDNNNINYELMIEKMVKFDDEMLCWSALVKISQSTMQQEPCFNSILLEYSKFVIRRKDPALSYPLWHRALSLMSHLVRQEYYFAWKIDTTLPILFKVCIEPFLFQFRYRTILHYNKSFAKNEGCSNMHRLLNIATKDWSFEYAHDFGIPVTLNNEENDNEITMILKQVPMDENPPTIIRRDHTFAFGELYNSLEPMGISSEIIEKLLIIEN